MAAAVRWAQFVSGSLLAGLFGFLVIVARPSLRRADPHTLARFASLDARLLTIGRWAVAGALGSGLLDLWRQVTVASGLGFGESLAAGPFLTVLDQTRYGTIWLVRHALLLLLGALLILRDEERQRADWWAVRLECLGLAAAAFGIVGAAGHAASAQEPAAAIAVDAAHLLATGIWFGSLVPLAVFLRWAGTLPSEAGGLVTTVATRRFSALGLAGVTLLTVTGSYNAWAQVASFAALFATPYGQWLCLKLALFLLLLSVAAINLLVIKPRLLEAGGADPARPLLLRRLRRRVVVEAVLGCTILIAVAVMGLITPARHDPLAWPFPFRFAWEATKSLPGVQTRVAIGSQLVLLGLVAALLALIVQRRRWGLVVGAGAAAAGLGLGISLPPLTVDAHPTTYLRPTVPYTATSIVHGKALYRANCASCHGAAGYGDGPAAVALDPKPVDLTAKHTADHTVGDLFWWVTNGIPRTAMPAFGGRLSAADRWDLINFARTLAGAERARSFGPIVVPSPSVIAPDFTYTTGVGEARALRDFRTRRLVLLVLFSMPGSLDRLVQLNDLYPEVRGLGGEVLGVPLRSDRDLYRELGGRTIFFPIVVDGAVEAAATYSLFRRDLAPGAAPEEPPIPAHMELLIDRQGYLRARWIPHGREGWADPQRLLAQLDRLATEAPQAPALGEHVH